MGFGIICGRPLKSNLLINILSICFLQSFLVLRKTFLLKYLWRNLRLVEYVEITEDACKDVKFLYMWEKNQTTGVKNIFPLN